MKYVNKIMVICCLVSFALVANTSKVAFLHDVEFEKSDDEVDSRQIWNVGRNLRKLINSLTLPVHLGVKITSMSGRVMFQQYQDQIFQSFDNTLLITAGAALYYLGPDYRFHTQILTDGRLNGHSLKGNIYLKVSGDPSLTGSDIVLLIGRLASMGIKNVTGNFYFDYFDYDDQPYVNGALVTDIIESRRAPLYAMIVNRNYVRQSAQDKTPFAFIVTSDLNNSFVQKIQVSDIKSIFSSYIQGICDTYGIKIHGTFDAKSIQGKTTIFMDHASEPLTTILTAMLKNSYAIYGDSLFKLIGAQKYSFPGTWAKGAEAIDNFLTQVVGIPRCQFYMEDGSGISRNNSVSPSSMVRFLTWMHKSSLSESFGNSLPPIERTKSLKSSNRGKVIKALTRDGSARGISALSGFVYNNNKLSMIFAVMFQSLISVNSSVLNQASELDENVLTANILNCLIK